MTRTLVPPIVQEKLPGLTAGGLALAADSEQAWLMLRSTAPEFLGAQPIDLRSELAYYDTGAVLELQLWLAGALVQPAVFQTWLDPANPEQYQALRALSDSPAVMVLFFQPHQDQLRFAKSFPLSDGVRQQLALHVNAGRLHAEHLPNAFWLAAKSEYLRNRS